MQQARLIPGPSRYSLSSRSVVRQIDRIGLAEVRRDADLPPHLVFGDLAAGIVLGKMNCADTKEQVRGQVFALTTRTRISPARLGSPALTTSVSMRRAIAPTVPLYSARMP